MKSCLRSCLPLILGVALLVVPVESAPAQTGMTDDPLIVISVESIDDLFEHFMYMSELAGYEDGRADLLAFIDDYFLKGIDRSSPSGVLAMIDGNEVVPLGFLPVTDFEAVLPTLTLILGEVEEIGDGVYRLGPEGDNCAYIKNEGNWVFISSSECVLEALPRDPAEYLGDLPENYVIAVQANVQNILENFADIESFAEEESSEIWKGMVGAIIELAVSQVPGEPDELYEFRKKLIEGFGEPFAEVIEQTDQITFGWAIDEEAGSTYLDISVTAVPGMQLSGLMESLQETTSNFSGFLHLGAAVTFNSSSSVAEADALWAAGLFEGMISLAIAEIERGADLDDEDDRAEAKEIVSELFGILSDTVASGEMDGGGALVLGEESLTAAFGMHVADGSDVEDLLHRLDALARDDPDFPGIVFDDDSHAGVSFHTIEVPLFAEEARQIFGDEMLLVIGTSDDSVFLAFGSNPIEVLEEVLDGSAGQADEKVLPFQLNIALAPIARFAANIGDDEDIARVADLLENTEGRDHISAVAFPIENGVTYRLEVEDGVLRVLFEEGGGLF